MPLLEIETFLEDGVFKPKTPVDLPNGTRILITQIVDQGEGKPTLLIGHIVRDQADGTGGEMPMASKE